MHLVPNVPLGKANDRHITRMMFPRLYEEGSKDRSVATDLLARIYDQGIRPAAEAVCQERLSHWPVSYAAAYKNAQDKHGKLHFSKYDLPADCLPRFARVLRRKLNRTAKLADMYFMHEVRGTKGFTVHDPVEERERWRSLQLELDFLNFEHLQLGDWWVDVGFEIYLPNHVVQWLRDARLRLLSFALPKQAEVDPQSLDRLVHDRNKFWVDHVAQFDEFAGFRCEPLRKGHADHITYLNVYTTDKEPTYQLHTGSFRRHNPSEILTDNSTKKLIEDIARMAAIFGQCLGDEERGANEGCARFEARIALDLTPTSLTQFPHDLLFNSVVAIPAELWWLVK